MTCLNMRRIRIGLSLSALQEEPNHMSSALTKQPPHPRTAAAELARRYGALFVNRLAYTMQSAKPAANGKHYYFRPKKERRLTLSTLASHLNGKVTIGLYALNPKTQRSKWVAI